MLAAQALHCHAGLPPHAEADGLFFGKTPRDSGEWVRDFLFSFDALVHANLIHHSNWLEVGYGAENPHGRRVDMSAELFAEAIKDAGGHVYIQEKINWGMPSFSDCLTLFG